MDPPDGKLPDEAIAAAAGKLYGERQIKTVFLCLGEGDSAAAERIAELMTTPYLIIKEGLPFRTVLGIVSGAEAMLSARLHASRSQSPCPSQAQAQASVQAPPRR